MYSRPLPDRHPLSDFFSEGKGRLYTGYLERIIPSSNCPSKLKDKVRRIVHAKLKLFHFQIKTYYLSDVNHQTDNPSRTNNWLFICKIFAVLDGIPSEDGHVICKIMATKCMISG